MENNVENKARFFAQYWGQKVLGNLNTGWKNWNIHDVSLRSAVLAKSDFLELTPLSDITDEDANRVVELYYGHLVKFNINKLRKQLVLLLTSHWNQYILYDYLRSKGYALPWMGLSVEQLIEYGWVKLKTLNK